MLVMQIPGRCAVNAIAKKRLDKTNRQGWSPHQPHVSCLP